MSLVQLPVEYCAALSAALLARGLTVTADRGQATMVVAREPPGGPALWIGLADDAATAAALLDRGAAEVVMRGDDPALIVARIARLARPALLTVGPLTIDRLARRAARDGRPLPLLPREYAVLVHLALHADGLVTRPQLRAAVWGRDFDPGTNVIEVHVSRLRAHLDRAAAPMLLTERGRGYRLISDPKIAERQRAV